MTVLSNLELLVHAFLLPLLGYLSTSLVHRKTLNLPVTSSRDFVLLPLIFDGGVIFATDSFAPFARIGGRRSSTQASSAM